MMSAKDPISKQGSIHVYGELECGHTFLEDTIQPATPHKTEDGNRRDGCADPQEMMSKLRRLGSVLVPSRGVLIPDPGVSPSELSTGQAPLTPGPTS